MKRNFILGLVVIAGLPLLNSCKDDAPKPAAVGFDVATESTTESDGTVTSFHPLLWQSYASATGASGTATGRDYKVKITLDKPASDAAVISYSLSGTAVKNSASQIGDYDVDGTTLTIDKGASEAFIDLTLFEDFDYFENQDNDDLFKTVTITLNSVVSGPVKLNTDNNVYTLTINEDDLLSLLQWNSQGAAGADLNVDMDMFLWNGSTYSGLSSAQPGMASDYTSTGKIGIEGINIPGGFPNATYGFSYVYYSGTSDPLNFSVGLFGTIDGTDYTTNAKVFTGSYSLANLNPWDDATNGTTPKIEQTIVKNGLNFKSASAISKPDAGSRMITPVLPYGIKRENISLRTWKAF